MRHGKKVNHLGRTSAHRKALLANLAVALVTHKRINTTLAKAKALRRFIEPLVTKAIKASKMESMGEATHQYRVVFSHFQDKKAITELFGPIAAKIGDRPGGYLRILRTGTRKGDGAETAMIEFVDFNEVYNKISKSDSAKRTRRGGKKTAVTATAPVVAAPVAAAPAVVETEVEEMNDQVADAAAETTEEENTEA